MIGGRAENDRGINRIGATRIQALDRLIASGCNVRIERERETAVGRDVVAAGRRRGEVKPGDGDVAGQIRLRNLGAAERCDAGRSRKARRPVGAVVKVGGAGRRVVPRVGSRLSGVPEKRSDGQNGERSKSGRRFFVMSQPDGG